MATQTYVALLRGINVGGHTKVPMTDLKTCFVDMGFENVSTYINSGNVIFIAQSTDSRKLETSIERGLEKKFGFPLVVVVRSLPEMDALMSELPASWLGKTAQKCNVIFLRHTIDSPRILDDLNAKQGIEELYYKPGALLWSAHTSNLTKSNMVRLASKPIYKEMTIRILNTARKIHSLMAQVKT